MLILYIFLTIAAVFIGISLWGRIDVSKFLRQYPAIDSDATLTAYKELVRRQMWGAVVAMVLGIGYAILCMILTMQMLLTGVLIVIAVSAPIFLLGRSSKKIEQKARTLPCPDPKREIEYRKVAAAWTGKLFPDF